MSDTENSNSNRALIGFGFLVIILGLAVRFLWLGIDPPLFFTGQGQALLTDPYNITYFARNKILFGSWDIFDYDRWVVFKYSLMSGFSYIAFLLGGVSRITANLSAVILSLAGIILFILAHRRVSTASGLIVSILLFSNMMLIVYGRYPFLENGLIFLCGLLSFLFIKYSRRSWMLILTGLLTALCALSGKMFGIVMIVPVLAVLLTDERKSFIGRGALMVISMAVSLILLSLLFYGGQVGTVLSYVKEQTLGMYGAPVSLTSPVKLAEKTFTFGGQSRLFYFSPFLLAMMFLSFSGLILSARSRRLIKENKLLLFNLSWFLSGFLLLMMFNYRPLRYQVFLLLPLSGIIASAVTELTKREPVVRAGWRRALLLFALCWYIVAQVVILTAELIPRLSPSYDYTWYGLVGGAVLWLAVYLFRERYLRAVCSRRRVVAVLLVLCVIMQSSWIYRWFNRRSECLRQTGEDVVQVVSSDAVIVGPYASAVTIDNRLKSFIYMFGLVRNEPELFHHFPLTHMVIDVTNWQEAKKDFPNLDSCHFVSSYWIRDIEISIIRLNDSALGRGNVPYDPTNYELAMNFYSKFRHVDSVFYYLPRFLSAHPTSKAALQLLSNYYMITGAYERGFGILDKLITLYPDDFSTYFDKAKSFYIRYLSNRDEELLKESDHYFELAKSLNPYIDKDIIEAKKHADSTVR
jgi:4-amino-4-deoxy-L-arabinose transferase-like glycosyltransferase